MENSKHFCTCNKLHCKHHPNNHELGCDPCIRKNLDKGEIPACFFRLVGDPSQLHKFTMADFVQFYLENKK